MRARWRALTSCRLSRRLRSAEVVAKLVGLAQACQSFDFKAATKLMQDLASIQWSDTREWHKGVRALVTLAVIKSPK